jgi:hypothetical protein
LSVTVVVRYYGGCRSTGALLDVGSLAGFANDCGTSPIGGLGNGVRLLGQNEGMALAVGVDDGSCSARGIGPVRTAI